MLDFLDTCAEEIGRIMKKFVSDGIRDITIGFIGVVVGVWILVLSVLGFTYLPWPSTDSAHMRDCTSHHGVYVKSAKDSSWLCDSSGHTKHMTAQDLSPHG